MHWHPLMINDMMDSEILNICTHMYKETVEDSKKQSHCFSSGLLWFATTAAPCLPSPPPPSSIRAPSPLRVTCLRQRCPLLHRLPTLCPNCPSLSLRWASSRTPPVPPPAAPPPPPPQHLRAVPPCSGPQCPRPPWRWRHSETSHPVALTGVQPATRHPPRLPGETQHWPFPWGWGRRGLPTEGSWCRWPSGAVRAGAWGSAWRLEVREVSRQWWGGCGIEGSATRCRQGTPSWRSTGPMCRASASFRWNIFTLTLLSVDYIISHGGICICFLVRCPDCRLMNCHESYTTTVVKCRITSSVWAEKIHGNELAFYVCRKLFKKRRMCLGP